MADTAAALWAEILGLVIRLHDREADRELISHLRAIEAPVLFDAILVGRGYGAATFLDAALAELGKDPTEKVLDEMAADFADLYLTNGYRIAPTGSVWMSDEHLERQEPMFKVREWYQHYDLKAPDWRIRSDDHLVHELQFVRHLLALGTADALTDAARFLDLHVLGWAPEFCARAVERARSPFHVSVAAITAEFLSALRDWLEAETGIAPDIRSNAYARAQDRAAREAEAREIERPFVPGLEPSW